MTIITIFAACNMRRVLTGCGNAVMTGTAVPQNLCMVNGKRWRPDIRVVAVLADVSR